MSRALGIFTKESDPDRWAQLHEQYAMTAYRRVFDNQDGIEIAIEHLELIVVALSPSKLPERWLRTCTKLSGIYRERTSGDLGDNVERAIYYGELALRPNIAVPDDLKMVLHSNLGAAYGDRRVGKTEENNEKEIAHLTLAVGLVDPVTEPEKWAAVQHNLGHAYSRSRKIDRSAHIEKAIEHYKAALLASPKEIRPREHAQTLANLATIYVQYGGKDSAANIERALRMYLEAARIYRRAGNIAACCEAHHNLALAFKQRPIGSLPRNISRAWRHHRWILERAPSQVPLHIVQGTRGAMALLAFEQGDWAKAHEMSEAFFTHAIIMMHDSYTLETRSSLTAMAAEVSQIDVLSLLKLGNCSDALVRLEEAKTRRMAEVIVMAGMSLAEDTGTRLRVGDCWGQVRDLEEELRLPPETPGRRPTIGLTEMLRQARLRLDAEAAALTANDSGALKTHLTALEIFDLVPENGAIISWLITPHGSVAFVVPAGTRGLSDQNVVDLSDFASADLAALINGQEGTAQQGWISSYAGQDLDRERWETTIMETTSALWTCLVQPVFGRLERLSVQTGAPVLILPDGTMGMLPVHAAWRLVNGRRRYLVDDFTILFAPSAFAYASSRRYLNARLYANPSLLAVVDSRQDLTYARLEGELIADMFPGDQQQTLYGDDVRPLNVIAKAKGKSHVHFACHGFYAWGDPLRSGISMADNRSLALWEVIARMDLRQSRLVTLSACESALTDVFDAPQEFTGLPAGFIQAGAPGVVGTFWQVDDLSTMLLMRRFYELHVQLGRPPAIALREAQLWLRDLTKDEAASELKRFKASTTSKREIQDDEWPLEPFPFDHPYYWAAFALHGS